MASVGHVVVGMAAARVYSAAPRPSFSSLIAFSALALLPDADVIGRSFGVTLASIWGHRGFTHSLVFAAAVGTLTALVVRSTHWSRVRLGLAAAIVVATHPLLDMLTNGGPGIAILWPFDAGRYFAPWNPIPVAPLGLGYLSRYGLFVAATETVMFSPLLVYALWPFQTTQRTG